MTYTWEDVGNTPTKILSQEEKEEIAARWNANEKATAERVAAEKIVTDKKAGDKSSGNQKLKNLGLTDDEISALIG